MIGPPNEHIMIVDGHVTVDGRPLHEPYARPSTFNGQFRLPEVAYLLLGDNRDASDDSRLWANPYVPRDQLTGRLHQVNWWRSLRTIATALLSGRRSAGPGDDQPADGFGASAPAR